MNRQKLYLQLIGKWRTLSLSFGFSLLLVSCSNTNTKLENESVPVSEINEPPKTKLNVDTNKLQIENTDSSKEAPQQKVARPPIKREFQMRTSEGVTDNKLNGEPILIQMELTPKVLANNPDTMRNYVKALYLGQQQNFPRSIADNFEQGISTERISYPRLNYAIEMYEDAYARKPYSILRYSVRSENGIVIVE